MPAWSNIIFFSQVLVYFEYHYYYLEIPAFPALLLVTENILTFSLEVHS